MSRGSPAPRPAGAARLRPPAGPPWRSARAGASLRGEAPSTSQSALPRTHLSNDRGASAGGRDLRGVSVGLPAALLGWLPACRSRAARLVVRVQLSDVRCPKPPRLRFSKYKRLQKTICNLTRVSGVSTVMENQKIIFLTSNSETH